jgi:flagellar hook-associated protein 3 FlgL
MRVTSQMIMDSTLRNIEQNQERIETLQGQITSGSRITKPSDDPIGAARALNLEDSIAQSQQYQRNIDQAKSWLNTTDSTLDAVTQTVQRVRELAVQAANDTLSSTERTAIQSEITQLQQHVLDLSHSKYGSYYVFSGTASSAPGYTSAAPSPAGYQGNSAQVTREIAPGTTIGVNADATATFDPLFTAMQTLQTGLTAGSTGTIQTSISQLDSALDAVSISRSQIGAKVNRLDFLAARHSSVEVNLTGLLSQTKDVDMAQALTSFSMAQNVYQASLKAGAQALQPSLLDYLR